jgi:hypothetical protein
MMFVKVQRQIGHRPLTLGAQAQHMDAWPHAGSTVSI